ncbi:MAG TPA: DUF2203 domain-containing protein [Thermoguttaceae bacterium]|nr:DUF2203 domain-containing protein [Thermoguttaceae bacterium]
MNSQCRRRRVYTVEEANAALPLVRAIVSDLVRLAHDVSDRSERLLLLLVDRDPPEAEDLYAEELVHVFEQFDQDRRRLHEYADELLELGVEPKSAIEGLVDFPTIIDGREARLCWKLGEPEVQFWYGAHEEYADRRRLAADDAWAGKDEACAARTS